jgi:hypothetical protein
MTIASDFIAKLPPPGINQGNRVTQYKSSYHNVRQKASNEFLNAVMLNVCQNLVSPITTNLISTPINGAALELTQSVFTCGAAGILI